MNIKDHIRHIPNFPKPGILFYDISTLLRDADAWRYTIDQMAEVMSPFAPEMIAGIESRGFLIAAPLAIKMGCGCMMVRKKEKLPGETLSFTYALEYGTDTIEVQADAVLPGQKVAVVDDLLATGGTLAASIELLGRLDADVVAAACVLELKNLNGRGRIEIPYTSLAIYDE